MSISYSVKRLQDIKFSTQTLQEKLSIKQAGRPTPNLKITQTAKSRGKTYSRQINANIYQRCEWICGCEYSNALFCFPCLLFAFHDGDTAWTEIGQTDLKKIPEKIKKHNESSRHINCAIDLSHLGRANIAAALDTGHALSVARHNESVTKNRAVSSKIINCIKFCGNFELPLRGMMSIMTHLTPEFFEDC